MGHFSVVYNFNIHVQYIEVSLPCEQCAFLVVKLVHKILKMPVLRTAHIPTNSGVMNIA